jgi:hypothetical protein
MIKGSDNLLKWFKSNDCPHWKILTEKENGKGGNFIASSPDNPLLSIEVSSEKLKNALEFLHSGRYVIVCKPEINTTKSLAQTTYDHTGTNETSVVGAVTNANYQANSGLISKEEAVQMIADALEKQKRELELQELKNKIKELETANKELEHDSTSAISGIVRRFEPFIEPVINSLFPQQNQVMSTKIAAVGYQNQKNNEADLELSNKLKMTLEKWQDLDQENFIDVIVKITETAQTDKATYEMYRKMLIGK